MPVYSMTGYASAQHTPGGNAEIATPAACLALELRSVNSRFLDVVLRLPDELRPHEPALRELIAKRPTGWSSLPGAGSRSSSKRQGHKLS